MTRKELVIKLAREIRIGARVIDIKEQALAAAAARELRNIVRQSPCVSSAKRRLLSRETRSWFDDWP